MIYVILKQTKDEVSIYPKIYMDVQGCVSTIHVRFNIRTPFLFFLMINLKLCVSK